LREVKPYETARAFLTDLNSASSLSPLSGGGELSPRDLGEYFSWPLDDDHRLRLELLLLALPETERSSVSRRFSAELRDWWLGSRPLSLPLEQLDSRVPPGSLVVTAGRLGAPAGTAGVNLRKRSARSGGMWGSRRALVSLENDEGARVLLAADHLPASSRIEGVRVAGPLLDFEGPDADRLLVGTLFTRLDENGLAAWASDPTVAEAPPPARPEVRGALGASTSVAVPASLFETED
jgi:hypothetical protein